MYWLAGFTYPSCFLTAVLQTTARKNAIPIGREVQVNPIKPTLTAPGTNRLKLKYVEPLSNVAFEFNLRRYSLTRCRSSSPSSTWTKRS